MLKRLAWTVLVVGLGLAAFAVDRADAQTPSSSPTPAGVTQCRFRALSNDPDPAGLNVRDAPDPNARVLGRLLPRHVGGEFVQAVVQVIGYGGRFRSGGVATGPYRR